jgi:putative dimethyl sulfoxide reductase chaperone
MDGLSIELRILASLLGAPDLDAKEAVLELATHYDWLQPAAQELAQLPLDEWQAEHTRLFVSGYPTTPCPPFESAYLSGRLYGPQTQAIKQLYKRMGMDARASGVPDDYLGTLLECAAHLNSDPAAGRVFWHELWNEHLTRWVPRFCRELQIESRLELYRMVAERLCILFPEVQNAMTAVA